MHKFLFTGPTLSWLDLQSLGTQSEIIKLNHISETTQCIHENDSVIFVLPPVAGGDLYQLKDHQFDYVIGIIDGYFENRISVWHKEILYLLSQNKKVFGASSMGALRAAELSDFGMIGVGKIYEKFLSGEYEDDDEVTVSHGPSEIGYPQISEAMVNIRFTLDAAVKDNVITRAVYERTVAIAKSTFYKKRNYGSIIRACIESQGMKETDFARFLLWLQKFRVDQKKADAISLVRLIDICRTTADLPNNYKFEFEDTTLWRSSIGA